MLPYCLLTKLFYPDAMPSHVIAEISITIAMKICGSLFIFCVKHAHQATVATETLLADADSKQGIHWGGVDGTGQNSFPIPPLDALWNSGSGKMMMAFEASQVCLLKVYFNLGILLYLSISGTTPC